MKAVLDGRGIAILPDSIALRDLRSGALVRVVRDYEAQPVNVYALYQSRRFLDATIRTFLVLLREERHGILEVDERELEALEGCEVPRGSYAAVTSAVIVRHCTSRALVFSIM
ncbi:hypothetical protein C0Z19_11410 [Trinickia soli]|uniref:LysR substrate-binding domain-containing protein n=1 Tax=Trinickia soli TaxID=380675 RepID=A0A2N7W6B3_9BURK|nr:hypothetical protein C0Z19_11410 [Trinickia soli]